MQEAILDQRHRPRRDSKVKSGQTPYLAFPLTGIYPRETLEHVYKETSAGRHHYLTFVDAEISGKNMKTSMDRYTLNLE